MINLIYLITRFRSNMGPVNQALNLVTGFDEKLVNVFVVTLSPEIEGESWLQRFENAGVQIIQLNKKTYDILGCVSSLKKIIKERNISVVHSSGFRPDICNMFLKKMVLTVTTQRSEPANLGEKYGRLWSFIMEHIEMYIIKKIAVPIACSDSLAAKLRQLTNRHIYSVQNGVDTDFFIPALNKKEIRKVLNLPLDKCIYVVVGYLLPRKNVELILISFMKSTFSNSLLLIIGEGVQFSEFKRKYAGFNINFVGHQSAPMPYIQASDYYISASLSEGLPNSVLESLSCGIPVILSDIDPHKEILCEGNIGCCFNKNDPEDLCRVINEINKYNYDELSQRCRQAALKVFSKYSTASRYLALYRKEVL